MQLNEKGLELLKRHEGLRLKAYRDVIGVLTIGYGHTGRDVHPGMVITLEQAESLLKQDLQRFEEVIDENVHIALNGNQYAALVSFTYNVGPGNFIKSKLLRKLNKMDIEGAAREFLRWNRAGGQVVEALDERRHDEMELFLS